MGTISNDFLTITYNNESQEKMAKYYMMIISSEPEFFKGLLNGLDTIKGHELRKFKIDENDLFKKLQKNRLSIINSILKLTGAKHPYFEVDQVSQRSIYYDVLGVKTSRENNDLSREIEYFDLAHDYFYMTGDFKYLKKYLYEELDEKDLEYLCDNKILNCLPELLKTKMHEDKYSFDSETYKLLQTNMDYILSIMPIISEWTNNELDMMEKEKNNNCKDISKIDAKEFDELVMGALNYIDPTNKLVEKYIELKLDDKIMKTPITNEKYDKSKYDALNGVIELYTLNNIADVIVFVHEFAHYNYDEKDYNIRENNRILSEYPSIYYEMKAMQYLIKQGYSKEEVISAQSFRTINNNHNIRKASPSLKYLSMINNKDEDTAIKEVTNYIDYLVEENLKEIIIDNKDANIEELKKQLKVDVSCIFLEPSGDIMKHIKYLIGTYLATFSIGYVKNENVLPVLEHIKNNKTSLEEVSIMLMDNNIYSSNYQKVKTEE